MELTGDFICGKFCSFLFPGYRRRHVTKTMADASESSPPSSLSEDSPTAASAANGGGGGGEGNGVHLETTGSTPGAEMSLEELQQQLKEMEEQQQALQAELQETQTNEPQLDSHLAVIEEQFREGFDDRFRSHVNRPKHQIWEDQTDVLLTNKIFREVSRDMGDEWQPVFTDLMSPFPPEVLDEELARLEEQPAIIRGYRALMAWKEIAGQNFTIIKLVDSLRKNAMDDIADATLNILDNRDAKGGKEKTSKPVQRRKSDVSAKSKSGVLDNRRMLLLAKQIGGDWEGIGKALEVPEEELTEIKQDEGSTYQGAFKMLWAWRQTQPTQDNEATVEILKTAFQTAGKNHLIDHLPQGSN